MATIFLNIPINAPFDTALVLKSPTSSNETILTNMDLLNAKNKGRLNIQSSIISVFPSHRNPVPETKKLPFVSLIRLVLPAVTLFSAICTARFSGVRGWDAIFPSVAINHVVAKLVVWMTLICIIVYEQSFHFLGSKQNEESIGLEVRIHSVDFDDNDDSDDAMASSEPILGLKNNMSMNQTHNLGTAPSKLNEHGGIKARSSSTKTSLQTPTTSSNHQTTIQSPSRSERKAAPESIPFRFIRATKGDVAAAKMRWAETCQWRAEMGMDTILSKPHPKLQVIKENYPHYFHLRGKKNECCYYERPAKMNLPALKAAGVQMDKLLTHYALCCEYMWTEIEPSEEGKSIYVIDLDGIGFRDFAGEVVDFVKRASAFTGAHYPERSGSIFVINVPSWFNVIWNVVKPMVDDVTKQKITIMKYGMEAITQALAEKIDIQNIPPEYGGRSMPLGHSPEEKKFLQHFENLNQ
jgi:hypothetical protein